MEFLSVSLVLLVTGRRRHSIESAQFEAETSFAPPFVSLVGLPFCVQAPIPRSQERQSEPSASHCEIHLKPSSLTVYKQTAVRKQVCLEVHFEAPTCHSWLNIWNHVKLVANLKMKFAGDKKLDGWSQHPPSLNLKTSNQKLSISRINPL